MTSGVGYLSWVVLSEDLLSQGAAVVPASIFPFCRVSTLQAYFRGWVWGYGCTSKAFRF